MIHEENRDDDGEQLAGGRHNGARQRRELFDGLEDAVLTEARRQRESEQVPEDVGVALNEVEERPELPGD